MRMFVAIQLPAVVRQNLAEMLSFIVRSDRPSLRVVPPESIHLTLRFLGYVHESRIPQIKESLILAAAGLFCFKLSLGVMGAFPSLRDPRVLWIGMEGDLCTLEQLRIRIDEALEVLGWPSRDQHFLPHVTLVRIPSNLSSYTYELIRRELKTLRIPNMSFPVQKLALMQSELHPTGPRYTRLASVKLANRTHHHSQSTSC